MSNPSFVPHQRWCEKHAKKGFGSRKAARRAIRNMCEPAMSEYRCDAIRGLWHVGHTPKAVISGKITRAQIRPRRQVSGG